MRFATRRAISVALALALGCAARSGPLEVRYPGFRFPADTFAFANQTIWEYQVDAANGRLSWYRREPRPAFALRCGSVARAARQFYVSARFDPTLPPVNEASYARLVHAVLRTDPRDHDATPVVIPGYPDLRTFSAAHDTLVREALGGPLPSYLQRGNWRMIFPFDARHQERLAQRLRRALARGWPPIVHVLRYPQLTINHMVLVYAADETPTRIVFRAYDPNDAERPIVLTFDRFARVFSYSTTPYFPGGPVKVYEVYDGLLF
jgi:hypothetical protein